MSNIFFPNPNVPDLLALGGYDEALSRFKTTLFEWLTENDPNSVPTIKSVIEDNAGLFAKLVQACSYVAHIHVQQANSKAMQSFASFAKGDMLDARVADLGIERQIIQAQDLNANPPIPEIKEDDESLLTRYYLASYTLKPGSLLGYEFHSRTVGERPVITVDSSIPGEVVVKYKFDQQSNSTLIRDTRAVHIDGGLIDIFVLTHDGVASSQLLNEIQTYIDRKDIKEASDNVVVKAATEVNYSIHVRVTNTQNQNPDFIKEQLEAELNFFADSRRKLNSIVRPEQVGGVVYAKELPEYEVLSPSSAVAGSDSSAPNCTGVVVEVI